MAESEVRAKDISKAAPKALPQRPEGHFLGQRRAPACMVREGAGKHVLDCQRSISMISPATCHLEVSVKEKQHCFEPSTGLQKHNFCEPMFWMLSDGILVVIQSILVNIWAALKPRQTSGHEAAQLKSILHAAGGHPFIVAAHSQGDSLRCLSSWHLAAC